MIEPPNTQSTTSRLRAPRGTSAILALLLSITSSAFSQRAFQNLDFEDTNLTVTLINPYLPYYATNATVPGWSWSPPGSFGIGDPYTTVAYNNIALDAPTVTLQGTDSPYAPAIDGNSILLQGGTIGGGLVT